MRALRSFFFFTPLLLLLILFLSHTTLAIDGVRQGLSLFFETVFPALFPFLVLSELILSSGIAHVIGRALSRPLAALFGVSRAGSEALVLGTLCGQPVASSSALTLYEGGRITQEEVQRISLFANNPSSGFLIAAVGGTLFGNARAGAALFCITLLSSALVGIALRFLFGKVAQTEEICHNGMNKRPVSTLFTDAVQRGFSCVLQVGAFLVFFSSLSSTLAGLLTKTPLADKWHALFFGCLEITAGIHTAVITLPAYSAFRLSAFLCGFGGVCVCMQILSITQKCELPIGRYLLTKLFQGGVALLLCEGYLRLFKPVLSPTQSIPTGLFSARLPVLSVVLILLFAGILFGRKRKEKFRT